MTTHPTREQLLSWGVDFIEIVNEHEFDNESVAFCQNSSMGQITGTDMHAPDDVSGWTAIWVPEFTEEAILAQLVAKNTTIIYDPRASKDHTGGPIPNPDYQALLLPIGIGNTVEQIYNAGAPAIATALSMLFGVFFVAEALRILKRRYWKAINEMKSRRLGRKEQAADST